jgi:hypothetical protein
MYVIAVFDRYCVDDGRVSRFLFLITVFITFGDIIFAEQSACSVSYFFLCPHGLVRPLHFAPGAFSVYAFMVIVFSLCPSVRSRSGFGKVVDL